MHRFLFLVVFLLVSNLISSQNDQGFDIILDHIRNNNTEYGLENEELEGLVITDSYISSNSGVHNFYFIQAVDGISIFGTEGNAHLKNGELLVFNQAFENNTGQRINTREAAINHSEAIGHAAVHLENDQAYELVEIESSNSPGNKIVFSAPELAYDNITARLMYYPVGKEFRLSYEVAINDINTNKWWQVFVDALDGQILDKISWTVECSFDHICRDNISGSCGKNHLRKQKDNQVRARSKTNAHHNKSSSHSNMASNYHVFPVPYMSPLDGPTTLESDPWNLASNASPYGWHDTDGAAGDEYTITRGNNVLAQEDTNGNNGSGYSPDGGSSLNFDFPFDEHDPPVDYQDFAITNLFFWNNIMHDVWYQYGFDEAAGNFQSNNYGNGGSANDYVLADAQDGSGTNNANFSTPPDGFKPRMQMFEWSSKSFNVFHVTSPVDIERYYGCGGANFGPQDAVISGELVETTPADACSAITNSGAINGKIALIDRGSCAFTDKVLEAQNAGAIAAVICQNTDEPPFNMGGSNASITIPSVMISKLNCDTIKQYLPGVNITFDVNSPVTKDSDLENGVIAHEYGHGISIRLTGGPSTSSCLNNDEQMGEGWSDWFAMIMTIQEGDIDIATRGMAPYLTGEPLNGDGIRTHPYTTDMNNNNHTYDDIKSLSVPHGVGSVWCAMLWEVSWALIDEYGWDPDIYNGTGGNNKAMELIIEALKLQPCSPGFVDGRDAILQADMDLNGGANECLIWEAFAKRGLGFSASQGSSASSTDGTEAFDLPPVCLDTVLFTKTTDFQVESGTNLGYTLEIINQTGADLTNVSISDTLPPNVSLVGNSLSCGTANGNIITIDFASIPSGSNELCEFTVSTDGAENSMLEFFDGVEAGSSNWSITSGQGSAAFQTSSALPYGGATSWFVENVGADNSQYLTSNALNLPQEPLLVFHHHYNTELGWDGGMVEISTDGGTNWTDLEDDFIQNGYNGVLGNSSNSDIDNRPAFTGNNIGYVESIVDLSSYSNQSVMIRFFFGSDNNTFETGWYIDNITIFDASHINNTAWMTSAQGDSLSSTVQTIVKTSCVGGPMIVYTDSDGDTYGLAGTAETVCDLLPGFASNDTDCNDNDASINPGATELCGDGIDNNCNNMTDEGCALVICDGDTLIINTLNDTEFYAKDHITSDVLITNGSDILFSSGIDIHLDAGFEVELGADFSAIIEDCEIQTLKEEESSDNNKII